ncbi:MAG TPA: tRNA (adenosine(37)-N6)-dimethylallyltransferase MiaA [Chthoniobacterales bacterium]|nr:tRNA (adenosine(37)-N6)-dimethylallyltransferase MiaA [Chthoniobacterales bacterium]
MSRAFFIVGPTATGKSEIAAEIAQRLNAEVISADAFQIYRGLDRLTAKPDHATLAKAPHHLLSVVPLSEEMNVEKFRAAALGAIQDIQARGKHAIVAGGSGLYVKALTHGLARLPVANDALREELGRATIEELHARLHTLDPEGAERIDRKNKRRLVRAVEVCLLTGRPFSAQRREWNTTAAPPPVANGVFVFRERAELYERIDRRVDKMFAEGVAEEVRALRDLGSTAAKALGLREIQALLGGGLSEPECIAKIQQATRRYAKRQLTWFQRQSNFEPLNLSLHGPSEATELIAQRARLAFSQMDD